MILLQCVGWKSQHRETLSLQVGLAAVTHMHRGVIKNDDCPAQFMRDIILRQKMYVRSFWFRPRQALKMENLILIAVSFYNSLSICWNWQDVRQPNPDITRYFPDLDPEYMLSRKFFWEIFASLHYEDVTTTVKMKERGSIR